MNYFQTTNFHSILVIRFHIHISESEPRWTELIFWVKVSHLIELRYLITCKNPCFSNLGTDSDDRSYSSIQGVGTSNWEVFFFFFKGGVGIYLLVAHHDNLSYLWAWCSIFLESQCPCGGPSLITLFREPFFQLCSRGKMLQQTLERYSTFRVLHSAKLYSFPASRSLFPFWVVG